MWKLSLYICLNVHKLDNSFHLFGKRFYAIFFCFFAIICRLNLLACISNLFAGSVQKQPSRGFLQKSVLKICSKFTEQHQCRNVISIKLRQLYWSYTLARVFSFKLAAYFQNTFIKEHLWRAAPQYRFSINSKVSFMSSGDKPILNLKISITNFCRFWF